MTNQDAFNQAVTWMLAQGKRSLNQNDVCVYRGDNGLRCAVGTLIPDAEYQPWFDDVDHSSFPDDVGIAEGTTAAVVVPHVPSLAGVDLFLLSRLQGIHDRSDVKHWRRDLKFLGDSLGLTWPLDEPTSVPVRGSEASVCV